MGSFIRHRRSLLKHASIIALIVASIAVMNVAWLVPVVLGIRQNVSNDALDIARRARSEINNRLSLALYNLDITADELAFNPIAPELILNRTLQRNEAFSSIALVNSIGYETSKVDRFKLVERSDLLFHGSEPFVLDALNGKSSFGPVFVSGDFEPHMLIAVPQIELGEVVRVLVADYNLRNILDSFDMVFITPGEIFVVDKSGFQIFHNDLTELLRHSFLGDRAWVKRVIEDEKTLYGLEEEAPRRNSEGEGIFTVGLPFMNLGWGVFVEQPRAKVLAEERRALTTAIVLFAVGMIASVVMYRSNVNLRTIGLRLQVLINENYESSKMLVKRDQELSEANFKLEELDQVKSEFVSVAAHQLRTPLTGIRWSLTALLEQPRFSTAKSKKLVADALDITMTALGIINSLLDVARIEGGSTGIQFKVVPIKSLLEDLSKSAQKNAKEKGIKFLSFIPESLPKCDIDTAKISIVLDNVFSNAIKYTNKGGQITLTAGVAGQNVEINISDTGIGIPKRQQHRVFSQFFRASNARRMSPSGTGIGLYMVKRLVERHGGSMSFISEEDKGSSFRILLPISKKV